MSSVVQSCFWVGSAFSAVALVVVVIPALCRPNDLKEGASAGAPCEGVNALTAACPACTETETLSLFATCSRDMTSKDCGAQLCFGLFQVAIVGRGRVCDKLPPANRRGA